MNAVNFCHLPDFSKVMANSSMDRRDRVQPPEEYKAHCFTRFYAKMLTHSTGPRVQFQPPFAP